jgi:hypothetical protein
VDCKSPNFNKLLFMVDEQQMTYRSTDCNQDLSSGSKISLIKIQHYTIRRYCHYKRNFNSVVS